MEERVQKILARAGYGSRRSCEELIEQGRVKINGQAAILGSKADATKDKITVDGSAIPQAEANVYIALHKPRGVISAVDAPGDPRPTVRDLVQVAEAVYPVGRLDVESEGLILLTNDGELTNKLTHPRFGHQKEYRVLVAKHPDDDQLEAFRRGVVLEDGYKTSPADVRVETTQGKGSWLNVVLREGRKRQIRETCATIGLPVVRIVRVRIGTLRLGDLKPREWRHLTSGELRALQEGKETTRPTRRVAPNEKFNRKAVEQRTEHRPTSESRTRSGDSQPRPRTGTNRTPSTGRPASRPGPGQTSRPSSRQGPKPGGRPAAKPRPKRNS
ncbi:MAG: rRNA pseudouridine synthase [Anaerolineaceae bacterium]|nr:rRNA pseudouridine synthase [Anaerolineaceae bacterium]